MIDRGCGGKITRWPRVHRVSLDVARKIESIKNDLKGRKKNSSCKRRLPNFILFVVSVESPSFFSLIKIILRRNPLLKIHRFSTRSSNPNDLSSNLLQINVINIPILKSASKIPWNKSGSKFLKISKKNRPCFSIRSNWREIDRSNEPSRPSSSPPPRASNLHRTTPRTTLPPRRASTLTGGTAFERFIVALRRPRKSTIDEEANPIRRDRSRYPTLSLSLSQLQADPRVSLFVTHVLHHGGSIEGKERRRDRFPIVCRERNAFARSLRPLLSLSPPVRHFFAMGMCAKCASVFKPDF